MNKVIVTTSWDDGALEDKRVLGLLNEYNLKGTFYIPKNIHFEVKKGVYLQRISDKEIMEMARTQDIGAHTMNHIYLNKLKRDEIFKEIKNSKEWLQNLLGREIKMFAYPGGVFSDEIIQIVKDIGFRGSRNSNAFNVNVDNPFLMGFSCHCYPCFVRNKEWSLFFNIKVSLKRLKMNLRGIRKLKLPISSLFSWTVLVKNVFDYVLKNGGIFHLYGHPWEIERYNLWKDLEKVFKYISNRDDIEYLTNSEIIEKYENSFIE